MKEQLNSVVTMSTGSEAAERGEIIQTLWSGYGEIVRYGLLGSSVSSAVLKHVIFPSQVNHPRGWHNNLSHQRKVKSYVVEMAWYQNWADRCDESCRVPYCYASETIGEEHLIVLEDLDAAGFDLRKSQLTLDDVKLCLSWLANFHVTFMGDMPTDLWATGTYWHLATRPDELAVMADEKLRDAAPIIDSILSHCKYQALVHGDAKVANFCFASNGHSVAAVDFQYVGGGCGMKDVAYLLGSCLGDRDHELYEAELLDYYFSVLHTALTTKKSELDANDVEKEWRALFAVAQTDFYRFLVGWMPTHWKINDYNKRVALDVVSKL